MRLTARAYWLPKKGSTPDEYEDAFWPKNLPADQDSEVSSFRVALADGATETSFSELWAKLLVRAYVAGRLHSDKFQTTLAKLQQRWRSAVDRRRLPWYSEEKARSGAAAAFLGVYLQNGQSHAHGRWEAVAVGDCCLVQMRDGRAITRFPIEHASEFSNRPFLLSSSPSTCEGWQKHLREMSGGWQENDRFFLMSDALAAWFLGEDEAEREPWHALHSLGSAAVPDFADWVADLRSARRIRNDDVTLVTLDIHRTVPVAD